MEKNRIELLVTAGFIIGAVGWVCTQPLLNYVSPLRFFYVGGMFALGVAIYFLSITTELVPWMRRTAPWMLAITFIGFNLTIADAGVRQSTVARHCAKIEGAILRPTKHTRTDLPAVFQALGCRPQG